MKQWYIRNKKADYKTIAEQFNISEVLAHLIVNRGIKNQKELKEFLWGDYEDLYSPYLLKDIEKASCILKEKIGQKKKIRIIGDYDVDGIMSTYILYQALQKCGAIADYEIPDRIKDGYGINESIVKKAKEDGVDTLLTCDNGIAAIETIALAKQLNMTVVLTDHHDILFTEETGVRKYHLPDADAVINPKQQECRYPMEGICGAAVAFKLVSVLYEMVLPKEEQRKEQQYFLPFVAIATVCDVMELKGENRTIVKLGLFALNHENVEDQEDYFFNIGLESLILQNGLQDKKIGVYHLGFILGPCLNASGRLESAKLGLALLLEQNREQALSLAKQLCQLNEERKAMTEKGVEKAIKWLEDQKQLDHVLVIYLKDCHESIAGIIAGRIRERYNRPVFLLTKTEEGVKGSGRSIETYNMYEGLVSCGHLLTKFGGHPMAAGLSLQEENIDKLCLELNEKAALTEQDFIEKVSFDMVLPLYHITNSLIYELQQLEPCGNGNPKPTFAKKEVIIVRVVPIGKEKNYYRLTIKEQESNKLYTAMMFKNAKELEKLILLKYGQQTWENLYYGNQGHVKIDIIFYPQINEYKGYETIQLIIEQIR